MSESALTSPTSPLEEFQKKVMDKLRADIGELMPESALKGLIERAVEESFFKPMPYDFDYNGKPGSFRPSWFVQEVTKVATPILQKMVQEYVTGNREVFAQATEKFFDDNRMLLASIAAMQIAHGATISQLAQEILTRMKQGY